VLWVRRKLDQAHRCIHIKDSFLGLLVAHSHVRTQTHTHTDKHTHTCTHAHKLIHTDPRAHTDTHTH
jgi:hypothetical protein